MYITFRNHFFFILSVLSHPRQILTARRHLQIMTPNFNLDNNPNIIPIILINKVLTPIRSSDGCFENTSEKMNKMIKVNSLNLFNANNLLHIFAPFHSVLSLKYLLSLGLSSPLLCRHHLNFDSQLPFQICKPKLVRTCQQEFLLRSTRGLG